MIIMFLVFILNRTCMQHTDHNDYVRGVHLEYDVYGTKQIIMIMFVVFIWNMMCMKQTDHGDYVTGGHLE